MGIVVLTSNPDLEHRVRTAARSVAIETASTLDDVRTPPADTVAIVNLPHPVDPAPYPSLRWIHTATAGIDAFLTPSLLERDVTLTSSAGNGGIALAEHALMLMMMLGRDTSRWYRAQQHKQWDRYPHGELAGRTVVIVGMGAVGRDLARKAVACHMRVIGVTRRPHDPIEDVDQIVTSDHLVDVAAEADFLVVAAPLTPSTTGLVGESVLAMLPAHAFVVCVSRGGIIDEDALIARLSDSRLAGAGLDAHEIEPLPAQSALWTLPNVIITPHNGATTDGTARRGEQILLDNVARFVNDQPLRNIVDATAGY